MKTSSAELLERNVMKPDTCAERKPRISPLPKGNINLFSAVHKHVFGAHTNVLSSCIALGCFTGLQT